MHDFVLASVGGVLIGLSATLMLVFHGRIAGISGITGALLDRGTSQPERHWRWLFLGGLFLGGLLLVRLMPEHFASERSVHPLLVVVAGGLVGFGTRLGSGCTSGHGVCGLSRFSPRSLVATGSFLVAGAVTVALARWGGMG